ncbi:unnamed protein product [Mytilus edulis]|uniref:Uncharacterized protein n=1 Tax=Mytilus edulis TaxID=6550 RepID=A0A8S3SPB1_MYTED|nr:unnamed protein product [Mytilus edulis]
MIRFQQSTSDNITVCKEPDDNTFHQLPKRNTKSDTENLVIQCTNDEFSTERELLNHQFVGKCQIEIEFNSGLNSDITKKKYYEKLSESSFLRGVLNLSAETKQMEGSENSWTLSWALKTESKHKRSNKNKKRLLKEARGMCKQNKHLEDDLEARRETEKSLPLDRKS